MSHAAFHLKTFLGCLLVVAACRVACGAQAVTGSAALPDAPQPSAAETAAPDAGDIRQFFVATRNSRYKTTVDPGEKVVPLTVREKFIYSARESVSAEQFFVVTLSAGYNHLIDGNPHYGSDGNGFGERVGATALREASVHLLGDGVFASALHQDPRYFRVGRGTSLRKRALHVMAETFTTHSDRDAHVEPDISGIVARAATAAMTLTYYPHVSATVPIAAETFGYSLLGEMAGDALLEFLPDLLHPAKKDAP